MPTPTYTPLANITLGSNQTTITFSNIPNSYRDLIAVFNGSGTPPSVTAGFMRFNGSTANYSYVEMVGNGSSGSSATGSNITIAGLQTGFRSTAIISIMDYAQTNKHKTALVRYGNADNFGVIAAAARWADTSAINSVSFVVPSWAFTSGSTFALYGVIA